MNGTSDGKRGWEEKMETIKDKAANAWENLRSQDPGMDSQTIMRSTMALIALAGFMLPWIRLDGHNAALTGADAIAYAITSPERATLFGASKIGTVMLLLVPPVTLGVVLHGLVRLVRGENSLGSHLAGAALPILMVALTGTIASSDGFRMGGIPLPGIGLIITAIIQGILFVDALVEGSE